MKIGFIRPAVDAHTLGISYIEQLLQDCGYQTEVGDQTICQAVNELDAPENQRALVNWIRDRRITHVGFSYRLDPEDGVAHFDRLFHCLTAANQAVLRECPVRRFFFAGLPVACRMVRERFDDRVEVFYGDDGPVATLLKLGIPGEKLPVGLKQDSHYDEFRMRFAQELLQQGDYLGRKPVNRSRYSGFGTLQDRVTNRVAFSRQHGLLPLTRAHVGPYESDRAKAVLLYLDWVRQLASDGHLDVLSIGTSQLTQVRFGEDWGGLPNGGGVPLNSEDEFRAVWIAARPMLVRTYAGTQRVPELALMFERSINIAWHALSFWWFCATDGRGPLSVAQNLRQHFETLGLIARSQKPVEPNVPHHFAFRGGDDISYVLSAVLAARAAKAAGVRCLVLQNMLNTPRFTWGVQDLAKSRVLLRFVRPMESNNFKILFQPRAGLDYFSHDLNQARAQLAAVSALMDDIEPDRPDSPDIIHVVSYSEGSHLADPATVKESIQITHAALEIYRDLRRRGAVPDMKHTQVVAERTEALWSECNEVLKAMEESIPALYTPQGLYTAFAAGFLIAPHLWEGRDEFRHAVKWKTRVIEGSVRAVGHEGRPICARARMEAVKDDCRSLLPEVPGRMNS